MEELAADADVSVGSIYGHSGNKDGLYLALVERASDLFAACINQARRIVVEGLTDPRFRDPRGDSRARLVAVAEPAGATDQPVGDPASAPLDAAAGT